MSSIPEDDSSLEREPTAEEQAALQWVVRGERGLTPEQRIELTQWLEESPRHRELFEEFGGTWNAMERVGEGFADRPENLLARQAPTFADGPAAPSAGGLPWRTWRGMALSLAAAAALAFGYFGWWQPRHYGGATATAVGVQRQVNLPDGSVVELNTDSTLVAAFTPSVRRMRLEKGEALFKVAKDPARPFIVEAAGVGIRAVGTAFNVRVRDESVEVLVTEGRVRVAPEAPASPALPVEPEAGLSPAARELSVPYATELDAGWRLAVAIGPAAVAAAPAPVIAAVPAEDMRRLLSWQRSYLDFADASLGEMVAEFNRYNRHRLVVADERLAAQRFGGSFRSDDWAGFVRLLRQNFGVQVEERGHETVLRLPDR